jgi:hypothetical protein
LWIATPLIININDYYHVYGIVKSEAKAGGWEGFLRQKLLFRGVNPPFFSQIRQLRGAKCV